MKYCTTACANKIKFYFPVFLFFSVGFCGSGPPAPTANATTMPDGKHGERYEYFSRILAFALERSSSSFVVVVVVLSWLSGVEVRKMCGILEPRNFAYVRGFFFAGITCSLVLFASTTTFWCGENCDSYVLLTSGVFVIFRWEVEDHSSHGNHEVLEDFLFCLKTWKTGCDPFLN